MQFNHDGTNTFGDREQCQLGCISGIGGKCDDGYALNAFHYRTIFLGTPDFRFYTDFYCCPIIPIMVYSKSETFGNGNCIENLRMNIDLNENEVLTSLYIFTSDNNLRYKAVVAVLK